MRVKAHGRCTRGRRNGQLPPARSPHLTAPEPGDPSTGAAAAPRPSLPPTRQRPCSIPRWPRAAVPRQARPRGTRRGRGDGQRGTLVGVAYDRRRSGRGRAGPGTGRGARVVRTARSGGSGPDRAVARRAHQRGQPLAIGSNSAPITLDAGMKATGLASLFQAAVCWSDVPRGRGKPAPDIFLLAAERLGVDPSRCLVFEDADEGTAVAGMDVFNVRTRRLSSPPRRLAASPEVAVQSARLRGVHLRHCLDVAGHS